MNYKQNPGSFPKKGLLYTVVILLLVLIAGICIYARGRSQDNNSSTPSTAEKNRGNQPVDSEMFTDRDMDDSYEESSASTITLADGQSETNSSAVKISGDIVTIRKDGVYLLSGSLTDGQIVIDANKTDKIQLVLKGVNITCKTSAPIYVKQADKVFFTLAPDSKNQLATSQEFQTTDENKIDGVIFSKDDITLNGKGTLSISSKYGHGIVSKDDLVITGGTYEIDAARHALSGKDSIRIADGNFTLTCGKDGLHGSNDDDSTLGFLYLAGGTLEINSQDDGMHSDSRIQLCGSDVNIKESLEGIEAPVIQITEGTISVTSQDDGLNASSGSSGKSDGNDWNPREMFEADENCSIEISGGHIEINASGDGIDSNGSLTVSGGETYVSGPTNSGNGALDYNGEGKISGGILVAAGASGMAQNFGNQSTQGSMLVNFSDTHQPDTSNKTAGQILLKDADNNTLISYTPETAYSCVVISCPEILQGSTYTVTADKEEMTVTMSELIYGDGGGMGRGDRWDGSGNDRDPRNGNDAPGDGTRRGNGDDTERRNGDNGMHRGGRPDGNIDGQPPGDRNPRNGTDDQTSENGTRPDRKIPDGQMPGDSNAGRGNRTMPNSTNTPPASNNTTV